MEGIKAEKVGEGMDGDAAEAAAETALEDLLTEIVEDSKVILWAVESGKEPEKVAEGSGKAVAPGSPSSPGYPNYPSYPPVAPPAPPAVDPPPGPAVVAPDSPTAPAEINRQLSDPGVSKVTLPSPSDGILVPVTMNSPLAVPLGKELEISGDVELIVPSTQTATIEGDVTVKGAGILDFSTLDDNKVALTGTITVESGGIFEVSSSSTRNASAVNYNGGAGTLVLKEGSFAYLVGVSVNPMIGPPGENASFEWGSSGNSSIEFSEDVNGKNIITLKGGEITVKGGLTPVMAAVIDSGAILIVDSTTVFAVVISLEVNGDLVADNRIVGGADGATITFDIGANLSGDFVETLSGGNFFWDNGGTFTPEDAVPGEIYTWNTNFGGRWERP
jgi:hypothetical protein